MRPTRTRSTVLPAAILGLLTALVAGPVRAEEPFTEKFEKAFELTGISKVKVQNVNGPVHIGTWDKDYIRVTAVKKAKGSSADETLRETEIRILTSGSTLSIETVPPKKKTPFFFWGGSRGVDVAYDLLLPGQMPVDVETVNGRITAEKRTGGISLNTVNGSVKVDAHSGSLHINTVNGNVDAIFTGPMRETDLETVNGSVTVVCSKESSIRYDLQTVNGHIESEFEPLKVEGRWGPKEARGEINGGRERLAVETVNGQVKLQVAKAD